MNGPDLFTVAEAAVVLRIGRTAAYGLAARDLATGGGEGLGVVRVGGQLRVRRAALEALVGGPVSWPFDGEPVEDEPVEDEPVEDEPVDGEPVEVGMVVASTIVPSAVRRPRLQSQSAPSLPFGS